MASRTYRHYWRALKGRVTLNFNWPGVINWKSVVLISASEYNPFLPLDSSIHVPEVPPSDHPDEKIRYVGSANVSVANISPHGPFEADPGGVTFVVNVDWPDPLPIVTDIIVLDPTEGVNLPV